MLEIQNIKLFTVEETAKILSVSISSVRSYIYKHKKLKYTHAAGRCYISEENIKNYLMGVW